jgi:Fe-S oxidoreductase
MTLADRLVHWYEPAAALFGRVPRLANLLLQSSPARWLLRLCLHMDHVPRLGVPSLREELSRRRTAITKAQRHTQGDPRPHLWIVQDVFTSFHEPAVVVALLELASLLGYDAQILPFLPLSMSYDTKGLKSEFRRRARRYLSQLAEAARDGAPLVGIEPAATLSFRNGYAARAGSVEDIEVLLPQEWLARESRQVRAFAERLIVQGVRARRFRLLVHCSERLAQPRSQQHWQELFSLFAAELALVDCGFCEIAFDCGRQRRSADGARSHEAGSEQDECLATSYACRSQIIRSGGMPPRHPVQALLDLVRPLAAGTGLSG